ncbi:MAG: LPS-assembly lipoprotein [Rhodobacteraceae bacterium HLUCCO07]|nr:MAG: LPS-assembly lipoprotein [Rhodobacteraceae bacterium HLUCCO07]
MWWSRRTFLLGALALPGCGFAPAYGPEGTAGRLQGTILIDAPQDRNGYLLVRHLEDRLGRAAAPRYGLSLALDIERDRMAVAADNITTRFNLIGRARYVLRDMEDDRELASGNVESFTGYSATGSTAATQTAEADAHERLMTILGDQIVTRLMAASGDLPE